MAYFANFVHQKSLFRHCVALRSGAAAWRGPTLGAFEHLCMLRGSEKCTGCIWCIWAYSWDFRYFRENAPSVPPFRPLSRQKWVCPPKKDDSCGAKLAHKNLRLVIYRPEPRGVFMSVNDTFPDSRVYP